MAHGWAIRYYDITNTLVLQLQGLDNGLATRPLIREFKMMKTKIIILFIFASLAAAGTVFSKTPFPEFTGRHVYVSEVANDYRELKQFLSDIEKVSGRTYYVVVVRSTGNEQFSTRNYADTLSREWVRQARTKGLSFDSNRSIIILMAMENRQISMHAGITLQTQLDLTGEIIDRDLVEPHFIPYAKKSEYTSGFKTLILETERWLQNRRLKIYNKKNNLNTMAPEEKTTSSPDNRPAAKTKGRAEQSESSMLLQLVFVLLPFIAFSVAFVLIRKRKRQRKQKRIKQEIETSFSTFQTQTVALMDRLDGLKNRHQELLFSDPDFSEPLTGDTMDLYNAVDEKLGELRKRWVKMMDACQQIEDILKQEDSLDKLKIKHVKDRMAESDQLKDINMAIETCEEQLDALEEAHEQAEARMKGVESTIKQAEDLIEKIHIASLETIPYQTEVVDCTDMSEQAKKMLKTDPIGTYSLLEKSLGRCMALEQWMKKILHHHERAVRVKEELNKVYERAQKKRSQGFRLMEEAGNPDPYLAQCKNDYDATVLALNRGEAEAAEQLLDTAAMQVDQAKAVIDHQIKAKNYVKKSIPDRRNNSRKLRKSASEAEIEYTSLHALHARESWRNVADNLNQARELLNTTDPLIDRAESESTDDIQRYLHAADLLEHVERQQTHCNDLIQNVGRRLQELNLMREECMVLSHQAIVTLQDVKKLVLDNERSISSATRQLIVTTEALRHENSKEMKNTTPNWPLIKQRLNQESSGLTQTIKEIQTDISSYRKFIDTLDTVREKCEDLGQFLRTQTKDRPRSNNRYHAAAQKLETITRDSARSHSDWRAFLQSLTYVSRDLDLSAQWAREDISLAQQAKSAINEARHDIQTAKGFYEMGISANVYDTESQLAQADRRLLAQDYEQTIELASSAGRMAREAHEQAMMTVRRKKQQVHQQRMNQAAAAISMAASVFAQSRVRDAGRWGGRGLPGRSGDIFTRPWSGQSSSSTGSFPGGSSQSNW